MNGFKKLAGLVLALFISACSQITTQITEKAKEDFSRTVELADKYGKPNVKQCFSFLNAKLSESDSVQSKLDELLKEPTSGIASGGLKLMLIKELVQGLNDPAKQAAFEADFKTNCSAVAGDLFLELVKDARSAAKRQPGIK